MNSDAQSRQTESHPAAASQAWWQDAVVYQIYPRSFADSSGDGIGDLRGILRQIDYISGLGIDAIWLNPIYDSPRYDEGYDVRDYYALDPVFGTWDDFYALVHAFHERGIRVLMDLVVNHTSDHHEWFRSSATDPAGPFGDFYIWRDGKDGGPPNNWDSFFGGPAWHYHEGRGQYYLHLFSKNQPDLNWENPAVRQSIYRMMQWWCDQGIDGFRMDVINMISKDPALPDDTRELPDTAVRGRRFFENGPRLHEYMREMRQEVLEPYGIAAVGECPGADVEEARALSDIDRSELDMVLHMELMEVDHGPGGKWDVRPWRVSDFARVIDRWQQGLLGAAWPANFLSNHDQPRAVSRFGDEAEYRRESAMLLATLLFTLSGTPFVYYGEEIGMLNGNYPSIEQYRDIDTLQYYEAELARGTPKDQVMAMVRYMSRDNARGPMQFDGSAYGGFSESRPWIPVGPSHDTVNVAADLQSERSVYRYYQRMIGLRRQHRALSHGWYVPVHPSAEQVMAYEKRLDGGRLLVVLNMGRGEAQCRASELPPLGSAERAIGNYPPSSREADAAELRLRPFEAVVYRLTGAEPAGT